MNSWITYNWKPACSGPMHLIADVHRAQKTESILKRLEKDCKTEVSFIPGGCTGLIQPVDVVINKPFKERVENLATEHMRENLDAYVKGQITARERRILFTKWVGQAWEEVSSMKEMVKRSFMKTGITVAVDGSQDNKINIKGLENYRVEEDDSSDDDPFSDSEPDEDASSEDAEDQEDAQDEAPEEEEVGDSSSEADEASSEEEMDC